MWVASCRTLNVPLYRDVAGLSWSPRELSWVSCEGSGPYWRCHPCAIPLKDISADECLLTCWIVIGESLSHWLLEVKNKTSKIRNLGVYSSRKPCHQSHGIIKYFVAKATSALLTLSTAYVCCASKIKWSCKTCLLMTLKVVLETIIHKTLHVALCDCL